MNEHDGDEADDDNDDEYIKYCWHKSPVKGGLSSRFSLIDKMYNE